MDEDYKYTILKNINEEWVSYARRILTGAKLARFDFLFDKFMFVRPYGLVGERPIVLNTEIRLLDCITFLNEYITVFKESGMNSYSLNLLETEIHYIGFLSDYYDDVKVDRGAGLNNPAKFDIGITEKVYNKCNNKLWNSINKEDFEKMLSTGNIIIETKVGNKQRISALFNRLGMLITNNAEWVKNVERSLGIDRLNKILKLDNTNSNPNKEFNDFLDEIHPL